MELLTANLLSPMVIAFALGFIAILAKSDLKLPDGLYASLSIYLLFAIGLKGGVALSQATISDLWGPVLATLAISVITPTLAYNVCRRLGRLDRINRPGLLVWRLSSTRVCVQGHAPSNRGECGERM